MQGIKRVRKGSCSCNAAVPRWLLWLMVLFVYVSIFTNLKRIGRLHLDLSRDAITGAARRILLAKISSELIFYSKSVNFDGLSFPDGNHFAR